MQLLITGLKAPSECHESCSNKTDAADSKVCTIDLYGMLNEQPVVGIMLKVLLHAENEDETKSV